MAVSKASNPTASWRSAAKNDKDVAIRLVFKVSLFSDPLSNNDHEEDV